MLLWPPLTGSQLSPVVPRSWVLPSGHTPGNRFDRRTKPGEGLRCCVCLHTRTNRPERRTALVARELSRYKVDIAALSEPRFSEQGQLEEVSAGYTFWSGRPKAERCDAGGHTPGNRFDRRTKPGEGLRCCVCLHTRTDGHLLNNMVMQAPTRVSTTTGHDLLFGDDCARNTVTEGAYAGFNVRVYDYSPWLALRGRLSP
ncbi:unnamed protein product [Schistocephalus solidus]|uniref:Endo/exonuclease/phosphatase domain-containing protein n=1 Tax=Schistocephalus solidus TaxID=70667 RepID=A0A183TPS5_SCHSO|nr:unnamed protein product [Schistocephalus solidus]